MGGGDAFYKQFDKIVNSNNTIHYKNQKFIKSQINNILAFSLIELSIVLIIIGLLISGVVGGQSLIRNAKQRSFISELREYKTAMNTFYSLKERLPSDANNDGRIGQYAGDNYNGYFPAPYNGTEYSVPNYFTAPFVDLYLNGIIDFKPEYKNNNQQDGLPTSNALKNDSFYYFVDLYQPREEYYIKDITNNVLILSFANSSTRYYPKFVSGIDHKIDDDNPSSGLFRVKFEERPHYYNDYITIPSNNKVRFMIYNIMQ